jgi:hypothetical protein
MVSANQYDPRDVSAGGKMAQRELRFRDEGEEPCHRSCQCGGRGSAGADGAHGIGESADDTIFMGQLFDEAGAAPLHVQQQQQMQYGFESPTDLTP